MKSIFLCSERSVITIGVTWKEVRGSNGKYKVSNTGEVWSKFSNRLLSNKPAKDGYHSVSVIIDGERRNIGTHRLVAIHFVDNPDDLPEVNHKDANKSNNNAENLEWCEHQHNMNHVSENRLHPDSTRCCIINKTGEVEDVFRSVKFLSRKTGINTFGIKDSCEGRMETYHGLKIRYYNEDKKDYVKTKFDNPDYKHGKTKGSLIRCIETGKVFKSQCEASREMGIKQPKISNQLNGKRKDADGYTFERVPFPKFKL